MTGGTREIDMPRLPWNVLWIGGFCYLVDADSRKIATLFGNQSQREAVAAALIDAVLAGP